MTDRLLAAADYAALKSAFRRLLRAAGGVESAASVTRVGKSQLADYGSVNRPGFFPPADVIADLESDTGAPVVTQLLCALSGGVFVRVEPRDGDGEWMRWLAGAGKEWAEVFQRGCEALEDGAIDAAEAAALVEEVDEALRAAATLREKLRSVTGSDAAFGLDAPVLRRKAAGGGDA